MLPIDPSSGPRRHPEPEIDWAWARRFIRDVVARTLRGRDPAEIEDVTQQALIGVYRSMDTQAIENHEAFMTTVAKRQALSFLRHSKVVSKYTSPLTEHESATASARPANDLDAIAWVRFLVAEALGRGTECHRLAEAYFAKRTWKDVATELDSTHAALRQRWSRCLSTLRTRIDRDDELTMLSEILREALA